MRSSLFLILVILSGFASTLIAADFAIQKTEGKGLIILHKGKPFAEYVVD